MTLIATSTSKQTVLGTTARLAVAAALLLSLAGCDLVPEPPVGSDPNIPGSENPLQPDQGEDETPPVVTVDQCVIGSWQVDNTAFQAYMNSLAPSTGVQMSISGASYMRFDDAGTFFSWRDDFTMTTQSQGQTIIHVSNSGETGDYGLVLNYGTPPTTDFLWVAETMTVMQDEVLTVDGIAVFSDMGGSGAVVELFDGYRGEVPTVEGEPMEGSLPITCEGDLLTFEFDAGLTMPYHRSSVTY